MELEWNISQEEFLNSTNNTNVSTSGSVDTFRFIKHVFTCIIIPIGLPLTLVAIYSLRSMVKDGNVASVYVINLLITDLLQFCSMIGREVVWQPIGPQQLMIRKFFYYTYLYFLSTSVGFMVCISLERYLVIAWPLWYRFRRTIKISVGVCVLVWILAGVFILTIYLCRELIHVPKTWATSLLFPLPLFIFFLVGTVKALSASRSVPSDEKRRIVGILVLVLLIYLVLILPRIILILMKHRILAIFSFIFLKLSPLADLFLYIFMKKGAIDKLLSSLCRCRMDSSDSISVSVEMTTA